MAGNQIYVLKDEPDDGDFAEFEELFEENMEEPVLPEKGQPNWFTRVVRNEKAEPSAATADDDMEA